MIRKERGPLLLLTWRLFRGLLPLAGALLVLALVCVLGKLAWDSLSHLDRYQIPFSQIDCASPPGLEKSAFLDEVQYLSGLPGRLNLLEEGLAARLAEAFRKHPWVEKVESAEIQPSQRIVVRLTFRRPVLAVSASGMGLRTVDRHGVLLPSTAPTDGLPIYSGSAAPPAGPSGTRWGDAGVEAAARAAGKP
jgi:hypothetical protein